MVERACGGHLATRPFYQPRCQHANMSREGSCGVTWGASNVLWQTPEPGSVAVHTRRPNVQCLFSTTEFLSADTVQLGVGLNVGRPLWPAGQVRGQPTERIAFAAGVVLGL